MHTETTRMRNVAIVAHVDHGKTSLVDQLLRQSGLFRDNEQVNERAMDSNDLERERGITILAKTTSIPYKDYRINLVDTPGHADFSGEVERIVKMVDGVLLVVDAFEGVMPQTRFVLEKALSAGLVPVVVVNKMDRPNARPLEVIDEVLDLLIDLGANEEQLEFPVVYTSAIQGTATNDPAVPGENMVPLFEAIIDHIPEPDVDPTGPLQWQVTMLDYNDYLGRIGIGRIARGVLRQGETVALIQRDGTVVQRRIVKLFAHQGLRRIEVESATAGDIVAVAGIPEIMVGETVADVNVPEALPLLRIDEPTLEMTFRVNDSPFAGQDGTHVTSRKLRERLFQELESDVSLRVEETEDADVFLVASRGELHLSILIETMRREGYELAVSRPHVILREENGRKLEPIEEFVADVPSDAVGSIIEALGYRKGEMVNLQPSEQGDMTRLVFHVPTRGLIGFRTEFLTLTKGYGTMHHRFHEYGEWRGAVTTRRQGVLVSMDTGDATAYSLGNLEDRGTMFVTPGTPVYEGMIVGEHTRENDLTVNVTKAKHQSNVRSATKDETVRLKAARTLSLEESMTYIEDDELCEITPHAIRLRKRILNKSERERAQKKKRQD
ncbi:translational GTPase TypA [Alicyclobacillus acidoterrestris]|uniref:Large ribosomal subunit assembly factor BipA n=1 Tax=Alicyclobacillus acidoterrestris (strain ATCC 49025 / DSM 3922 / CIP 106132 / NCIMB 13137 / GD3B) TaxID=1356854 RepID=T0BQD3_ALIAG|nr:translational GTPase TypA [Alicyclobacillus acidoterrestris]EPZ46228.1 GTP-binding protein TypA [Alicyclobacillus acidoterrestris ATCC 49025]UNO47137.1 translational GTPase TypA [Alicyclobacillus acidoterrestris]